jgi:GT2 family glycosyltransferase
VRSALPIELALASCADSDKEALERWGWRVRSALEISTDIDDYARYIGESRGEFTVAKGQNVQLQTGWFSDRSATYLAAGRPVITQDTGFGDILPTGEGLFAFRDIDDALAAIEAVNSSYPKQRRAASAIAHEFFRHDVVLGDLLEHVGLPRTGSADSRVPAEIRGIDLEPRSRRPLVLDECAEDAARGTQIPEPSGSPATFVLGERRTVSVVVVTFNNLAVSRLCIESLLLSDGCPMLEVVVVDNGSSDGTPAFLRELAGQHANLHVLLNDDNLGFAAACNQGLGVACGEILAIVNNDTIVPPHALARLARHLDDVSIGLVGPTTNRAGNEARIPTSYRTYYELLAWADHCESTRSAEPVDIAVLTMFCVALRRDTFVRVGKLDERFGVGMFEDDDYAIRVRQAGLRVVLAEDVFVHHFGEAAFGQLIPTGEFARIFQRNQSLFESKWHLSWDTHGSRTDSDYVELRERVCEAVRESVPSDQTILVVSKGDDDLLDLSGRCAWHFPRTADGRYAGCYPADSDDAIAQLEELAARGARYFVVPATSFWWLDHYAGLVQHLGSNYRRSVDDSQCVIFERVTPVGGVGGSAALAGMERS